MRTAKRWLASARRRACAVRTVSGPPLVVCWDLEATGPNYKVDRCVEIGAVESRSGAEFSSLVHPGGVRVTAEAAKVHGITDSDLDSAPDFGSVWDSFSDWMAEVNGNCIPERVLLISHAAQKLDAPLIRTELRRTGRTLPESYAICDSCLVLRPALRGMSYRQIGQQGTGLYDWVAAFGLPLPERQHRAVDDAKATWMVVREMLRRAPVAAGVSVEQQLGAVFPAPTVGRGGWVRDKDPRLEPI
eukprot:TRINITY_DN43497_c0_g1_i1.p1 TRINITY_DN43497_c0_g1~~TRINITY_DN43497_c0_g1_i1.p1  ORF type:complete len:245 (+),score=16.20 TRINITY_DN43497_c0_g1_i1:105-839(+)